MPVRQSDKSAPCQPLDRRLRVRRVLGSKKVVEVAEIDERGAYAETVSEEEQGQAMNRLKSMAMMPGLHHIERRCDIR